VAVLQEVCNLRWGILVENTFIGDRSTNGEAERAARSWCIGAHFDVPLLHLFVYLQCLWEHCRVWPNCLCTRVQQRRYREGGPEMVD